MLISFAQKTSITTQRGDGITNVKVIPLTTEDNTDKPAILHTLSGEGRTDVTVAHAVPHRSLSSIHQVQNGGDMYLRYAGAGFNGPVALSAKSYSAKNLHGGFKDGEARWAGEADGGDSMEIKSPGWVGLYF